MAYSENDQSLIDFYTSILTLHQEAQNRINSVFEGLKLEAISLVHKNLFARPKLINYENEDFKGAGKEQKEDKKDRKNYKLNKQHKEYEHIKNCQVKNENEESQKNEESEEDEDINENEERKKDIKVLKENKEHEEGKNHEENEENSLSCPLPVKRPRDSACLDIYPPFLEEYKQKVAERKEMICKLYFAKVSPKYIARLFSLSVNSVHMLGNWKQVPLKIAQKNREIRQNLKKLLADGLSFKKVVKQSGLNNTSASIMLDEYPVLIVIKSPEEKKSFIESAINNGVSKALLARVTRIQPLKIYTWTSHLENNEEFSDDECIEDKSGEYSRETIRKTCYDYYLNKSIEGAAERNGVTNLVKIEEWIRILKDFKRHRRGENGFD